MPEPWKKRETARLLDLFLADVHSSDIAKSLGRDVEEVKQRIRKFANDENGRATNYEPVGRASRKGKKLSKNESRLIMHYSEKKMSFEVLAKVLCRQLKEISPDHKGLTEAAETKRICTTLELLFAYQYCFFCCHKPVVSDEVYDTMKAEEIEYGGNAEFFSKPGPMTVVEYPLHIRYLGMYLMCRLGGPLHIPPERKQ